MPAPNVVSTDPTSSATGVVLNSTINITFDTDMLASSVGSATVVLRSLALDVVIDANISVSGAVVTVLPYQLLIADSIYQVAVMGADMGLPTGGIKSSDGTTLVDSYVYTFQSGTGLDTESLPKTQEEIDLQGDIFLPNDVIIQDTGFNITASAPSNHSFSIRRTREQILLTFSRNIDETTVVDGSTFQVTHEAFLGEEELLAVRENETGDLLFQQDYTSGTDTGYDFSDITGELRVYQNQISWNKDTGREWPANSYVEIFLDSTIADTGGNQLGTDQKIIFYSDPYPDVVNIKAVRNELGTSLPSTYYDDYIGLRIWFRTVETWEELGRTIDFTSFVKNRAFKKYVLSCVALDLLQDIRSAKDLGAGVSKSLGDFRVSYFPQGAETLSRKEDALEKSKKKAWETMMRDITRPGSWVKGRGQTSIGSRQWRLPIQNNLLRGELVSDPIPAANTARERDRVLPGYGDAN